MKLKHLLIKAFIKRTQNSGAAMRTITERNRLDARLKAASKCVKFIKKHINRNLGIMLQDVVDDIWNNSY